MTRRFIGGRLCALLLVTGLFASAPLVAQARTVIDFWHTHEQEAAAGTINALAEAFNESQQDYQVVPQYVGNYQEASVRLVSAIGTAREPVLFDAEGTIFVRLAEDGAIASLRQQAASLEDTFIDDMYDILWRYGELHGERYGLPWNLSMPVLVYNADLLRQRGVDPPSSWEEFEAAAERLTTRQTRGYINVSAAFIFETMVTTRGGRIVTDDGRPNFDSPEALEALTMLKRISDRGHAINRSFAELDVALVDFVRTRGMMAFSSLAFWTQGERFNVAFNASVAPVPTGESRDVPIMGGQLVVMANSSPAQQQGAFEFWRFMMESENMAQWVRASYFLPVTRSATELLEPWFAEDPIRRAALDQLEHATLRPRVGGYAIWQGYLEEAIERVVKGGADPQAALSEAQRRAEAEQ